MGIWSFYVDRMEIVRYYFTLTIFFEKGRFVLRYKGRINDEVKKVLEEYGLENGVREYDDIYKAKGDAENIALALEDVSWKG